MVKFQRPTYTFYCDFLKIDFLIIFLRQLVICDTVPLNFGTTCPNLQNLLQSSKLKTNSSYDIAKQFDVFSLNIYMYYNWVYILLCECNFLKLLDTLFLDSIFEHCLLFLVLKWIHVYNCVIVYVDGCVYECEKGSR